MKNSREHLLQIAFRLFLEKSYKDVTMSELVKRSGLSKGAFYHYFDSKEKLFIETTERYLFSNLKVVFDTFDAGNLNLKQTLLKYMSFSSDLFEKLLAGTGGKLNEVNFYKYFFEAVELYPKFNKRVTEYHEEEIVFLTGLLDKAKEKSEIKKNIDSYWTAQLIHTLLHGIAVLNQFDVRITFNRKSIEKILDNFYSLIKV